MTESNTRPVSVGIAYHQSENCHAFR